MLLACKRILMPWTACALGALPLLLALLVLPREFLVSRSFTILLVATYGAGLARFYVKRVKVRSARFAPAMPFALLFFLVADVMAFVHLEIPFWPTTAAPTTMAARSLAPEAADREVFLVEHGWHTGLIVETKDLSASDLPYFATLRRHRFLEVGWGDAAFFQADDPTVLMALDAMLTPGPSVLHVAAFDAPPADFFKGEVIHRLPLTSTGVANLGRFVARSFADQTSPEPAATSPGDHGADSRYVAANGSYYFPNTCNVWTANALLAGGLDVTPALAVTSRALLHQVRQIAKDRP